MSKLLRLLRYDWPLHFVLLLTNWLPDNVIFLRMRGSLAKYFLGSCGKNLRLGRNICFYNPRDIFIGRDVYIAYGCWFMAGGRIIIDDEVLFGPYCVVVSSNHTRNEHSYRYGAHSHSPIRIGRGCWIAAHVTLVAGSCIDKGTLVAAGSTVTGTIPANVLVGGLPARVLKKVPSE